MLLYGRAIGIPANRNTVSVPCRGLRLMSLRVVVNSGSPRPIRRNRSSVDRSSTMKMTPATFLVSPVNAPFSNAAAYGCIFSKTCSGCLAVRSTSIQVCCGEKLSQVPHAQTVPLFPQVQDSGRHSLSQEIFRVRAVVRPYDLQGVSHMAPRFVRGVLDDVMGTWFSHTLTLPLVRLRVDEGKGLEFAMVSVTGKAPMSGQRSPLVASGHHVYRRRGRGVRVGVGRFFGTE